MKRVLFYALALISFCLPFINVIHGFAAGIALLIGILFSSLNILDCPSNTSKLRKLSLNSAVVLFGFGLNIQKVISVGKDGLIQTLVSLIIVFAVGYLFFKLFSIDKKIGSLIVFGTAICGGSAIAATAPLIDADEKEIGISTGVVFLLNTIALFLFAFFASTFKLDAQQFGTWAALSIHDTSSVVGAAASHSNQALQYATILKLTRTLWIIPIVLFLAIKNNDNKKVSFPIFILFFILASIISSVIPAPQLYDILGIIGKSLLSLALFLVGTSLNIETIKSAGAKSIAFGVCLWMVSIISGYCISVFL